jgi:lipoyl(octanoyl) transferase
MPTKMGCPLSPRDFISFPTVEADARPVQWMVSGGLTAYSEAVEKMEARVAAIADKGAPEAVWLVEHPPLYTAGTSARDSDLLDNRFPVHRSGRGGQYTYHGPGQRVAYVMLDLSQRRHDVRAFVGALEAWIMSSLADLGVRAERRDDRVGVWVPRPDKGEGAEDKIAAIGIRVRRWVTFHGMALNVAPDLSHFNGIVPCGINASRFGVTSLADLGRQTAMQDIDAVLRRQFETIFGPTRYYGATATSNLRGSL